MIKVFQLLRHEIVHELSPMFRSYRQTFNKHDLNCDDSFQSCLAVEYCYSCLQITVVPSARPSVSITDYKFESSVPIIYSITSVVWYPFISSIFFWESWFYGCVSRLVPFQLQQLTYVSRSAHIYDVIKAHCVCWSVLLETTWLTQLVPMYYFKKCLLFRSYCLCAYDISQLLYDNT